MELFLQVCLSPASCSLLVLPPGLLSWIFLWEMSFFQAVNLLVWLECVGCEFDTTLWLSMDLFLTSGVLGEESSTMGQWRGLEGRVEGTARLEGVHVMVILSHMHRIKAVQSPPV